MLGRNLNYKDVIILHVVLMLYSLFGIFSKYAAQEKFLSVRFIVFYGVVLLNLALYAVCWQQIIKRMPLVFAYANKAVTVIWGIVFGYLFWKEEITISKIIGGGIIVLGIVVLVTEKEQDD